MDTALTLHKTKIERALGAVDGFAEFSIALHPGLRLRRYPTGATSWLYRYRLTDGRVRVIKLGAYPDLTPNVAADRWRDQRNVRSDGLDPLVVKVEKASVEKAKAEAIRDESAAAAFTVTRLAKIYIDTVSTPTSESFKRSWKEDKRILDKYVKPSVGSRSVTSITSKDVRRILDKLAATPIMRDRTLACARSVWNWARINDHKLNSVVVTDNPWTVAKIPPRAVRERVLTIEEQRKLAKYLRAHTDAGSDAVALLLLTGCRREEVTGARCEEFDAGVWTIPGSRTKNGATHVVHLSPWANEIVERHLGGKYLFPSSVTARSVAPEFAYKHLREVIIPAFKKTPKSPEPNPFTLHDMRRTFATFLGGAVDASSGMPVYADVVIDRVLGHVKRGVVKHYNHARLDRPAKLAWAAWCDHLMALTQPSVVQIGDRK